VGGVLRELVAALEAVSLFVFLKRRRAALNAWANQASRNVRGIEDADFKPAV